MAAKLEAALKDVGELKAGRPPKACAGNLRPIIVYGLSDTKAAAQAVLEQGGQELVILSPSGVAHSLGPQWFKELLVNTAAMFSELRITGIMDCGPYEGHVMNALHAGLKHVRYTGDEEAAEKLAWIGAKTGAVIHRKFKEILDLKGVADQLAACREWQNHIPAIPISGKSTRAK